MESCAGHLLVATPLLLDPNFSRTVVLVLEHDDQRGAFGVVLNRPTPVPVGEILERWHAVASEPAVVFVGGPVQRDVAIGLGRASGDGHPGVVGDVALIDLGSVPEAEGNATGVRVFSGYSGWDAEQLEEELDEGAWFVVAALEADVLTEDPESLWRRVLARQRSFVSMYATYPDVYGDN